MNYRIGNVSINSHTGVILDKGLPRDMRPKTLQVLLCLLRNRDRSVTRQELMQTVWHDVVTQEYVLYQSINEIRAFFQDPQVVRTFPRQGYQWVAPIAEPSAESVPAVKPAYNFRYAIAALVLLLLTPFIFYDFATPKIFSFSFGSSQPEAAVQPHMLILHPLVAATASLQVNSGAYSQTQTDALAEHLRLIPLVDVQLAHSAQAPDSPIVPLVELTPASISSAAADANAVSLHARLYRQVDGYQLHYVLLGASFTVRNVIFGTTADESFAELAATVGQFVGEDFHATTKDAFAGEALFLGMEAFVQRDYAAAETFLHAAAILQPEALPLWRYLSRAQIQQGKFDLASATIREALNTIAFVPKNGFELRLLNQLKAIANPASTPNDIAASAGVA